jgi:hypothetical protein
MAKQTQAAQDLQDELRDSAAPPLEETDPPAEKPAKKSRAKKPKAEAAAPEQPTAESPPETMPDPNVRRFVVTLAHTNGEGTIRPPFEVELVMTDDEEGVPEKSEPLEAENPNKGVRITMPRPEDDFDAGVKAHDRAVKAFNDHYHIRVTEHKHRVHAA